MEPQRRPDGDTVARLVEGLEGRLAPLAERLGMDRRAFAAVVALTALGLLARLVALGSRVMHFDEGRVTFWALHWHRTGEWQYRYIVHGPLIQHVDRWLFALAGSGDFVARLPVALVGAALPLVALLFRDRLRDVEVAALSGLLALNPLLLYYSRFMRSDLLVATFAFVALGALVRLYETRRPLYLYAATLSFAFAFASKENAVVYALCWLGMFGLVAGLEVLQPRRVDSRTELLDGARVVGERDRDALADDALAVAGHAGTSVVLFGLVTLFFFAPRSPASGGVGLWGSDLWTVTLHTVADMRCGMEYWTGRPIELPNALLPRNQQGNAGACTFGGGESDTFETFVDYLGRELLVLGKAGATVAVLSVVGVVAEFRDEVPRVLVPAAFYWGVASLVGYPLGSDILYPPWLVVHALVPLAIPAAVGLVSLGEWTVEEVATGEPVTAAANVVVVVLLVGSMLGTGVHHAYVSPAYGTPGEASVVQFAQPEGPMKGAVRATVSASRDTEGLDVLVYDGQPDHQYSLVDMDERDTHQPACMRFLFSLPLSWYLYSADAEVECADNRTTLRSGLASDPPVVVTRVGSAGEVRRELGDEYVSARYEFRQGGREVVFFFDATRVNPPERASKGSDDGR